MSNEFTDEFSFERFEEYKNENKAFFENKIVRSFLASEENEILFRNAFEHPTKENEDRLDIAFKKYYFNIRFTSFISSAIYFNAINFDKKNKKMQHRFPLTVDQSISVEDEGTFKDIILDLNSEIRVEQIFHGKDLLDYIEDPLLYEAVHSLTERQKEILNLAFVDRLSDTEIGRVLNKSQQVISKTRKKALKSILNYLNKKGGANRVTSS